MDFETLFDESEMDEIFSSPPTSDLTLDDDVEYNMEELNFDSVQKKETAKKEGVVDVCAEKAFDSIGVDAYKNKANDHLKKKNRRGVQSHSEPEVKKEDVKCEEQKSEKKEVAEEKTPKKKLEVDQTTTKNIVSTTESVKEQKDEAIANVKSAQNSYTVEIDLDMEPEEKSVECCEGEVEESVEEHLNGETGVISHESSYKQEEKMFSVNKKNKQNDSESESIQSKKKQKSVYDILKKFDFIKSMENLKKIAAFVIMVSVITGIPLIATLLPREKLHNQTQTEQTTTEVVDIGNTEQNQVAETTTEEQSTESQLLQVAASNMTIYTASSGFETIDDLTLYINSNQGVILTEEKTLVSKFNNGQISRKDFLEKMGEQTDALDELAHLLNANKSVYENHGQLDKYEALDKNIDTIMSYGDQAIVNAAKTKEELSLDNVLTY